MNTSKKNAHEQIIRAFITYAPAHPFYVSTILQGRLKNCARHVIFTRYAELFSQR